MVSLAIDLVTPRFSSGLKEALEYDDGLSPAVTAFLWSVTFALYVLLWPLWLLIDLGLGFIWLLNKWDDWRNG